MAKKKEPEAPADTTAAPAIEDLGAGEPGQGPELVDKSPVELTAPADTTAIGAGDRVYDVVDGKVMARPEDVGILLRHGCRQEG